MKIIAIGCTHAGTAAVKEAAKEFNTEKYVLLEWQALETSDLKTSLKSEMLNGTITKRLQLKRKIHHG